MAKLAGSWDEPTLTEDFVLEVEGRMFDIPSGAEVNFVLVPSGKSHTYVLIAAACISSAVKDS